MRPPLSGLPIAGNPGKTPRITRPYDANLGDTSVVSSFVGEVERLFSAQACVLTPGSALRGHPSSPPNDLKPQ
jgi:hypothetical protein